MERDTLHNTYIKRLLTSIFYVPWRDLTPELIAMKREQLLHRRLAKELWDALGPDHMHDLKQARPAAGCAPTTTEDQRAERARSKSRDYYYSHLEQAKEKVRRWKKSNPDKVAAQRERHKQRVAQAKGAKAAALNAAQQQRNDS